MPNPVRFLSLTPEHNLNKSFERDEKLIAFCEANGINTSLVPADCVIEIDFQEGVIHYPEFETNALGRRVWTYDNGGGEAKRFMKTVPLKVEPQEMGY